MIALTKNRSVNDRVAMAPNQAVIEKSNEFWGWLCRTALLLHSAFQDAEQNLILEENCQR